MARRRISDPSDLEAIMGFALSDEQVAAVAAPMAPGVIIAGAGTGKTTVMAARVVWLVGTGAVTPDHVLGLTFTRKAAGELADRVARALALLGDEDPIPPTVFTYDAFAARVVSEFGAWLGVDEGQRVVASAERFVLADRVIRQATRPPGRLADQSLARLAQGVVELEERIQAHLVKDEAIVAWTQEFLDRLAQAPTWRGNPYAVVTAAEMVGEDRLELLNLCRQYRDIKHQHSVTEFSDQMAQAVDLVDRIPVVGQILRARHTLVVVDEFQDTSAAQGRLLQGLFGHRAGVSNWAITAVGDPLQAIYTWRGAAVDNIHSFHRAFGSEEQRTYELSTNRRSGGTILAAANAVAADARADPLLIGHAPAQLRALPGAQSYPVLAKEFSTWEDEVAWIADSLADARLGGDLSTWSQAAILVRRNREVGPIFQACRRRGVPVAVSELGGLLSIEIVSQVCAMMRLLSDDTANPAVIEILAGPRFRVSPADLGLLGARARQLSVSRADDDEAHDSQPGLQDPVRLLDGVHDPGQAVFTSHARACFARLSADLGTLGVVVGSVVDQVHQIISQIGLDAEVYASVADQGAHLRRFLAHVAEFASARPDARLSALVAYLDAEEQFSTGLDRAIMDDGTDAVQIMTVHRAKGLEWDTVYLPCLVDKVFPGDRLTDNPITTASALPTAVRSDAEALPQVQQETNTGLKEYADELRGALALSEDRLAYVGMTRAKRRLILTTHRWAAGTIKPKVRSRYFDAVCALGSEVVQAELLPPGDDTEKPHGDQVIIADWPHEDDPRWRETALAVLDAARGVRTWPDADTPEEARDVIAGWDDQIALLASVDSADSVISAMVPSPMSTSQLARLCDDQAEFARRLARPLPQPPSRSAQIGSRFHAWVEQYYADSPLPQMAEVGAEDDELAQLRRRFLSSPFASARPWAVEAEIATSISGHPVTGRIDAVFRAEENGSLVPPGKRVLVVDWKTGVRPADPVQLAVYAQAWATQWGMDIVDVAAGFYYVATSTWTLVDVAGGVGVAHALSEVPACDLH